MEAQIEEQSLPYFSPISGRWTRGQSARFLCPDGLHPSTYGYGVMGAKLAAALRHAHVSSSAASTRRHS